MKDICTIYLKDNKALVKKLISKLESDGISCWVGPRDFSQEDEKLVQEIIDQSKILLIILDNNSSKSKQVIDIMEYALENDLHILPFVTGKVDSDLYSEYFFYTFSWVDAYEDEFDEAYEVLLEAIDELSEGKTQKSITKKKVNTKDSMARQWYIAAISIAILLVSYFVYNQVFTNENEAVIVGEWRLSDYSDNLQRTRQDSINLGSQIQAMRRSALMIFNDDNSFERRGFAPEPQIGEWEIDKDAKNLYLIPLGEQKQDRLSIETLTENLLVLVVNEKVPGVKDSIDVNTKLTFSK